MVRTLLLSSSSTSSSSDTTTTASRDSTASTDSSSADLLLHHQLDSDSARPSSATDDEFKRNMQPLNYLPIRKPTKYFSLPKLFRKDQKAPTPPSSGGGAAVRRVSTSAREVIRKYLKKVKPFYEKLSQKQQQQKTTSASSPPPPPRATANTRFSRLTNTSLYQELNYQKEEIQTTITHSFSGNLRMYNRGRSCFSSCPSSMGSSPNHGRNGYGHGQMGMGRPGSGFYCSDSSSMEELQNAIQGAIMHCKNSMLQNKNLVSNEI
ncbi:hypothetical protein C2S53_017334 [Perilla frutescens var. hirtella]|uniref:Membrane-associated kinase regulator 1 n=1 Tax=Perilla frutescens var. hirtella TaxID=608512 RepID=A0AAD4PG72_PERFH|nr:hypothetical protein C2S53_017334 [Perilla frutescens var. hirtella]